MDEWGGDGVCSLSCRGCEFSFSSLPLKDMLLISKPTLAASIKPVNYQPGPMPAAKASQPPLQSQDFRSIDPTSYTYGI